MAHQNRLLDVTANPVPSLYGMCDVITQGWLYNKKRGCVVMPNQACWHDSEATDDDQISRDRDEEGDHGNENGDNDKEEEGTGDEKDHVIHHERK